MENFSHDTQNILVTGGAGFIGSTLVKRLLIETQLNIYNLDKLSYASEIQGIEKILQENKNATRNRYQLLQVDLTDYLATSEAVSRANPDIVFHLAAESHVDRSIDNPNCFINSNINGTFNLLQVLRIHWEKLSAKRKAAFRFIHISTDEVFGSLGDKGKFSETTKYDPRSPYSASKAASDHLVNAWFYTYGFPAIITNCSNNYGPWQFPEKLIPLAIQKAINQQNIPLYGDGSNIRDWLFVEDHIDALLLVSKIGRIGKKYCIGGNGEKTNKEIVFTICRLLDEINKPEKSYSELITFVADRPGHDHRYAINAEYIQRELGWKAKHTFEEGIIKTIRWYINNESWCKEKFSGDRLGLKNNNL